MAAVEHSEVRTSDPVDVREHVARAWGDTLTLDHLGASEAGVAELAHRRAAWGAVAIDDVHQRGHGRFVVQRLSGVLVVWLLGGHAEFDVAGHVAELSPGDLLVAGPGDGPVSMRLVDCRLVVVTVDPRALGGCPAGTAAVRFTDPRPVDRTAADGWKQAVTFVKDTVFASPALHHPDVLAGAQQLLVGATLATFAHAVDEQPATPAVPDSVPPTLRRAIEFIEDNAGRDIGVVEIAGAVYVTPRRVQAVFKKHLGMTPTGYLRRVRLQRAYDELLDGDRSTVTVTSTAARWRFAHTGRFAVSYRQCFGESPHETLRRNR